MTKAQARANRKIVRKYWQPYLNDGHIMGWLNVDEDGILGSIYEPQGQAFYCGDKEVLHQFGDVYRAHGQMPKKITLKDFVAENDLGKYLAPAKNKREEFGNWLEGLLKPEYKINKFFGMAWEELLEANANDGSFRLEGRYTLTGRTHLYRLP